MAAKSDLIFAPKRRTYLLLGIAIAAYFVGGSLVQQSEGGAPGSHFLPGMLAATGLATVYVMSAYLFFTHLRVRPRLTISIAGAITIVTWAGMVFFEWSSLPSGPFGLVYGLLLATFATIAIGFWLPFLIIWHVVPISWLEK